MNDYRSVLEYLTIENPVVISPEKAPIPSRKQHPFGPKELRPWEEFNMRTLRSLYKQQLFIEAVNNTRNLRKPRLGEDKHKIKDEETTKSLIFQWTVPMTREALLDVQYQLHPATWSSEISQRKDANGKPVKEKILRHDIATISLCPTCGERDFLSYWKTTERFPKEVKPYPQFNSSRLEPLLKEGRWDKSQINKGDDLAIRQAYTYCIRHGCRYGCILSTHEAFIFRIKPLRQAQDPTVVGDKRKAMVIHELRTNGLMEFVSVPWKNHRVGGIDEFDELTVNFSLWVLHILAGNSHEVDWEYPKLVEETLVQQPCVLQDDMGEASEMVTVETSTVEPSVADPEETSGDLSQPPQTPESSSQKRTWENSAKHSFCEEPILGATHRRMPDYIGDEGDTEDEEEMIPLVLALSDEIPKVTRRASKKQPLSSGPETRSKKRARRSQE